jgi:hypothetical protein
VVASFVLLSLVDCVGAFGFPVKVGESSNARADIWIELSAITFPVVELNTATSFAVEVPGPVTLPLPVL